MDDFTHIITNSPEKIKNPPRILRGGFLVCDSVRIDEDRLGNSDVAWHCTRGNKLGDHLKAEKATR